MNLIILLKSFFGLENTCGKLVNKIKHKREAKSTSET